jgi:hypothetical protein
MIFNVNFFLSFMLVLLRKTLSVVALKALGSHLNDMYCKFFTICPAAKEGVGKNMHLSGRNRRKSTNDRQGI